MNILYSMMTNMARASSVLRIINSLRMWVKKIKDVRLGGFWCGCCIYCVFELILSLGMKRENITVCDSEGVVYKDRDDKMDQTKRLCN